MITEWFMSYANSASMGDLVYANLNLTIKQKSGIETIYFAQAGIYSSGSLTKKPIYAKLVYVISANNKDNKTNTNGCNEYQNAIKFNKP